MPRHAFALLLLAGAAAAETVGVPGSDARFPARVDATVTGQEVRLALTGTALRARRGIHAYAVAAYVLEGAAVHSAEDLAAADCPKRLHLVMERAVDGRQLADAFRSAVRLNHPEPAFAAEVRLLEHYMRNMAARKGEHLLMTHLPGIGLHIRVAGKVDFVIRNVAFSRAIWDIYLGKRNLGEHIKRDLTSRL